MTTTDTKKKYMVHYIAGDGTMQHFSFKTERSFRLYHQNNYDGHTMLAHPFIEDMGKAVQTISKREDSSMAQHGGFSFCGIRRIKCMDTGETKFFTC